MPRKSIWLDGIWVPLSTVSILIFKKCEELKISKFQNFERAKQSKSQDIGTDVKYFARTRAEKPPINTLIQPMPANMLYNTIVMIGKSRIKSYISVNIVGE